MVAVTVFPRGLVVAFRPAPRRGPVVGVEGLSRTRGGADDDERGYDAGELHRFQQRAGFLCGHGAMIDGVVRQNRQKGAHPPIRVALFALLGEYPSR